MKAARIVAILFNKAKKLDSFKELTEVIFKKENKRLFVKIAEFQFSFFFKFKRPFKV